jgi:RHH-type transcriptional regulator, proline utilization regulon repressor / proline dehydrogenase / delta 1-pyrroline-5-carboxylate dehydrogenase
VIDENARATIENHIVRLEKSAKLIARAPQAETQDNGVFVRPAAFAVASLDDVKDEIFGPVLHVVTFKAEKLGALIDQINALGYGLTLGIHTRIDETMHNIAARARVGNIYVNRNQIGAVVGVQPFGGEGLSGTGPKAGGPHYLKALQTRSKAETSAAALTLIDKPLSKELDHSLDHALKNFTRWSNSRNKIEIFEEAAKSLSGNPLECINLASSIYRTYFADSMELSGPTGESNTLKLRGRGLVLCLGGGNEIAQIAKALAAGNCVIPDQRTCETMASALEDCFANIFYEMDFSTGVAKALLLDDRIRAVVYDGGETARANIQAVLAQRTGSIIPLLTSNDAPWRFAVERTLTINTTAAGGDVRLLSLGE